MAKIQTYKPITFNIEDLKFDESNPNQMSDDQMVGLGKGMDRHGFLQPILVDQNNLIIDGEHRVLALKEHGDTKVQGYQLECNDAERRLIRQEMNKTHGMHDIKLDASELMILRDNNLLDTLSELIAVDKRKFENLIDVYDPAKADIAQTNENLDFDRKELELKFVMPDKDTYIEVVTILRNADVEDRNEGFLKIMRAYAEGKDYQNETEETNNQSPT